MDLPAQARPAAEHHQSRRPLTKLVKDDGADDAEHRHQYQANPPEPGTRPSTASLLLQVAQDGIGEVDVREPRQERAQHGSDPWRTDAFPETEQRPAGRAQCRERRFRDAIAPLGASAPLRRGVGQIDDSSPFFSSRSSVM